MANTPSQGVVTLSGINPPPGLADVLASGRFTIVSHDVTDLDGIGSAIALRAAYPGSEIYAPSLSKIAKRMVDELGIPLLPGPGEERTLIVDTASSELLPEGFSPREPVIIDHHVQNEDWSGVEGSFLWIDPSASSCSEMVARFLLTEKGPLDRTQAFALVAGILADTGNFRHADNDTVFLVAEIMRDQGISIKEVYDTLDFPDPYALRIARLKGSQRIVFRTENGGIVAGTVLKTYEGEVARHLIRTGADISFVVSQRRDEVRVSARAARRLNEGFHLGEFLQDMANRLDMTGGGHAGAAGMNGTGDAEAVLNVLLVEAGKCMKKLPREIFKD